MESRFFFFFNFIYIPPPFFACQIPTTTQLSTPPPRPNCCSRFIRGESNTFRGMCDPLFSTYMRSQTPPPLASVFLIGGRKRLPSHLSHPDKTAKFALLGFRKLLLHVWASQHQQYAWVCFVFSFPPPTQGTVHMSLQLLLFHVNYYYIVFNIISFDPLVQSYDK